MLVLIEFLSLKIRQNPSAPPIDNHLTIPAIPTTITRTDCFIFVENLFASVMPDCLINPSFISDGKAVLIRKKATPKPHAVRCVFARFFRIQSLSDNGKAYFYLGGNML